ncbi:IS5/IS1182 family transposase [Streptomyces noursei]|uniref:transposase family protein n=2 Tax=Streptomyces noursei TaxID=1971 RepID=UPI00081C8A7B|nr:transposase IS4 family protein [Streptomyces noursei ATCC 11455]ANZ13607.1 transposase IS4 family protein [Streptomyces noursei ATCC 11455]ANZ21840.1 transposase IS4 family protein [Streptomyces noursei ATCC 11455]MCZ0996454.1 IS5/IS1182 family transposase [Streptomyces noursei]
MVRYSAMLDVPRPVVEYLSRLLAAHRRAIGTPKGSRALGPFRQAVLILRWFREKRCVHCAAVDAGISQATGYRYLHEGIDVLAGQAPDLHEVLQQCRREGTSHVVLDGTLIECDRLAGARETGTDWWYSAKHKAFGGNIQFLSAPDGTPLWVSDVEPGSVPDITATRHHVLPALYKAAAEGLPTLADKGYQGAGIGVHTPIKRPCGRSEKALHVNNRTYNQLLRGIRALGERTAAELKQRWRALQHVTLSPSRIGAIAQAALTLNNQWK